MANNQIMDSEANSVEDKLQDIEQVSERLTESQKEKMKKFFMNGLPFMVLGQLFTIIFMSLVLSDLLDISKLVSTKAEELHDIQSRIGYVLKYSTPGVLWIILCLFGVMFLRTTSPAMDPTSGSEHIIQNGKNILNNSFEQFVLALVSQLILVQYLDAEQTLKYIPGLSFLFIIGRFTFWLGYPKYRLFGFSLNITPLFITMAYNFIKPIYD